MSRASREARAKLEGSERPPLRGARRVGGVDRRDRDSITVILRRRGRLPEVTGTPPTIDRREFAERYGADPVDIERVRAFAAEHKLQVVAEDVGRRTVELAGSIGELAAAFAPSTLELNEHPDFGRFRARTGGLHVPAGLSDAIEAVLGLDNRPAAVPHFRRLRGVAGALGPRAAGVSYTPLDIGAAYRFPRGVTGAGQTIAIIELGGGYVEAELRRYWAELGVGQPELECVEVGGATNAPGADEDVEVMLDIEIAGALAPGARLVVYFAPNTTDGFYQAISRAIHDGATAVSISWGRVEDLWTVQALETFSAALQDAAFLGGTVLCASGDEGSSDGLKDGRSHVDFPAASPWAVACGGTWAELTGGTVVREVVWNDDGASGGGVSRLFRVPPFQLGLGIPAHADDGVAGRGVPDVAGVADPRSGWRIRLNDGDTAVVGGTSAVAPMMAALVALAAEALGQRPGFVLPQLYRVGDPWARDVVEGSNGRYFAGPGYDLCTGWGTPLGDQVVARLRDGG